MRNVAAKLPRKYQEACVAEAKTIYQAHTRREAVLRFRQWAAHWRIVAPNAVRVEDDLDEPCPSLTAPRPTGRRCVPPMSRGPERFGRPMSCFQNSDSVERIIFGVISHLNTNWKAKPLPQFTHKS